MKEETLNQLINTNNKEYWESRKRPGEEIMKSGFVMAEGFEKTVVLLSRIAKQFDEAVFSGKNFRFELRWDQKAKRTFWCFFDSTECDEGASLIQDPDIPKGFPEPDPAQAPSHHK